MRKFVFLISLLIFLSQNMSCSSSKTFVVPTFDMREINIADSIFYSENYNEAAIRYKKIAAHSTDAKASRIALSRLATLYMFYQNDKKNYKRALKTFRMYLKKYPDDRDVDRIKSLIFLLSSHSDNEKRLGNLENKSNNFYSEIDSLKARLTVLENSYNSCSALTDSLTTRNMVLEKVIDALNKVK